MCTKKLWRCYPVTRMEINSSLHGWVGTVFSGLFGEAVTANDRKMLEMLRAVFTKTFAPWKACQDFKLYISQTELGFSMSIPALCSVLFICSEQYSVSQPYPYFWLYSTSFPRPQKVSIFAGLINKSPILLPLSSAPGDVAIVSHSSLVYALLPLIHLTHCCYWIHLWAFDLLSQFSWKNVAKLTFADSNNFIFGPPMKSCREILIWQLDKKQATLVRPGEHPGSLPVLSPQHPEHSRFLNKWQFSEPHGNGHQEFTYLVAH